MGEWLGRIQQGGVVVLGLRTCDASGLPVQPNACPTASLYAWTGAKLRSGLAIPVRDPVNFPGLFSLPLVIDSTFPVGPVTVCYSWTAGTYVGGGLDSFYVLPVGDPAGPAVGLRYFELPQTVYLVQQTAEGTFRKGKNPSL